MQICNEQIWLGRSYPHINWNPAFVHKRKVYSCTTQKHQVLALAIDGHVCFYRQLFADAVKPRRCMKLHVMVLGHIIRTAWGTKVFLMAIWAPLVDFTSSCHLLKAQHCSLSPNECFTQPSAPHLPPPPFPPTHPYRINPWYYRSWKKISKTSSIKVTCRNSHKC